MVGRILLPCNLFNFMGDAMNPLSPNQILRNLENGFFMTHKEQEEAAQYIRQLQQENLTLLGKRDFDIEYAKYSNTPEYQAMLAKLERKYPNHETYCGTCGACTYKPWIGLTDEEILDLWIANHKDTGATDAFARAIEAKLKEKNGG